MATRDLTRKFVEYRSRAPKKARYPSADGAGSTSDDSGLLDNAGNSVNWSAAKDTLPPVWVDMVDQVEEDIRQIQEKIRALADLHTQRLMVTFDEGHEADRDREIDQATAAVTGLFRHAEGVLRQVGTEGKAAGGGGGGGQADARVRENIQRSLARKLQSLSMNFRNSQKEYLIRVKAQKTGDDTFDFLSEEKNKPDFGLDRDTGFTAQQMAVLEDTETLVQERDQEINHIVQSIEELSTIFKELAVLVIDQGTVLDRIDYNMELVVESTKEGITQLEKAEKNQKSARPLKCIAFLVAMIVLMLVLLIMKHAPSHSSTGSSRRNLRRTARGHFTNLQKVVIDQRLRGLRNRL